MNGSGSMWALQNQTVSMNGSGEMEAFNYYSLMTGEGDMDADQDIAQECDMSGESLMYMEASGEWGYAEAPLFQSIGADYENFAFGNANMPAFGSEAYGGEVIPEEPQYGFGWMPLFVSGGDGIDISVATGNVNMPIFDSLAADEKGYAEGYADAPPFWSEGMYGVEGSVSMISWGGGYSGLTRTPIYVILFTSYGTAETYLIGETVKDVEMFVEATAESYFALLGTFNVSMLTEAVASALFNLNINDLAALDENAQVWVVNMDTGASGQYEQYGFNSFFTRRSTGEHFGVAEDGIYKLEGDDDDGEPIQSFIDFGVFDLGDVKVNISKVYFGVASSGKLYLKAEADGVEYTYQMESYSDDSVDNHRFAIGKGLKGSKWRLSLVNTEGYSHDLATVHFEPLPLNRKI